MTGLENKSNAIPRVVVVNDNSTQLNLLCGLLRKAGFDPIPFTSAEIALAAMGEASPPALIITDLYMPGIDGWRFCRLLRSPEYIQYNPVPILVVSATFSGDEPARITSELGANAFLPMPVDGQQFIEQVQALLKGEKPQHVLKVLIVEDDRLISNRLVKAFQAHNYQVEAVFTYQEALTRIGQVAYDVAVMDYHLPDGLGDMLLNDLEEKSLDCVCMMMTADPQPELALKWMKLGAAAYIQKPFEPEYMIAQCEHARREHALLSIQDLLEIRTRQLQKSEARFRYAMEATRDGLWDWDLSSGEYYCSPAYFSMLGYSSGELSESLNNWYGFVHPDDREAALAANQACIQNEVDQFDIEFRMQARDGSLRWIRSQGKAVRRDANGQAIRMIGTHADITEQKIAEEALRTSEQNFREIFNSTNEGIFIHDAETGQIIDVNDSMLKIYGYETKETVLTGTIGNLSANEPPYTDDRAQEWVRKSIQEGSQVFQWLAKRRDGSTFWAEVSLSKSQIGGKDRVLAVVRDISERKQLESALKSRLVALTRPLGQPEGIKFEDLFDMKTIQRLQDEFSTATGVASIITLPDGTPITQPSNFCRLCSDIIRKTKQGQLNCFKSDGLIGRYHPEGPIIQPCISGGLWDGGAGISVDGRHIANWLIGQVRDETQTEENMRLYARTIGADEDAVIEAFREVPAMSQAQFSQVSKVLFTLANQLSTSAYQNVQQARFISAKKKAEESLKESEEKFRSISENSFDLISLLDLEGNYRYCNGSYTRILGYSPDELIGRNGFDLIHPDEKAELYQLLQSVLADRQLAQQISRRQILNRVRCLDGSYKWIEHRYRILLDEQGNIHQILMNAEDITERKRVEDALRSSEEKFSTAFRISPDSININRLRDGMYIEINEGFSALTGYTPEEVRGKTSIELNIWANPQDRERLVKGLREKGEVINLEAPFQVKDGTIKICLMSARIIEINQEKCILSITRDITERKQVEQALRESEIRYRALFEQEPDGVVILNPETGQVIEFNDRACQQLGYTREEFAKLRVADIEVVESAEDVKAHIQKILTEGRGDFETQQHTKQGEPRDIQVIAQVIEAGEHTLYHCIWRDITEQKQTGNKINEQLEELRRWNNITMGREDRILQLKKEVNRLLVETGKPARYASAVEENHE